MKSKPFLIVAIFIVISAISSCSKSKDPETKIIFLHHSTGGTIWKGNVETSKFQRGLARLSDRFQKNRLPILISQYNKENKTNYAIEERIFPKAEPYGWKNYPFDYYNIWVKNAGDKPYIEEPTLEILTKDYNLIIFKHCFPVSNIQEETDSASIDSEWPTLHSYKEQYEAIKNKIHEFPDTKFILFTGAVQVKYHIDEEDARRAKEFFDWVRNEWDIEGDNLYLWDLYELQTEGGLYFKDEYAVSPENSHPNPVFADRVSGLLLSRVVDVIENNGKNTDLQGNVLNTD